MSCECHQLTRYVDSCRDKQRNDGKNALPYLQATCSYYRCHLANLETTGRTDFRQGCSPEFEAYFNGSRQANNFQQFQEQLENVIIDARRASIIYGQLGGGVVVVRHAIFSLGSQLMGATVMQWYVFQGTEHGAIGP